MVIEKNWGVAGRDGFLEVGLLRREA